MVDVEQIGRQSISVFFLLATKKGVYMMKKITMLIMLLLISMALYGCGGGTSGNSRELAKPQITAQQKSDSIDAAVYLDGTFSMGGYVNYPSTTVYSDGLKNIERTLTSTWKQEKIQYIKFGDSLQTLSREQFLTANSVGFYQEKDTSLQTVIDSMDKNKLNILVTDLFQTNNDIDSLIISLKKACFADNSKAMALIGVRSQFNGKIYDVGKGSAAFMYASKDDKSTYRPFYLLVLGNEADVRTFTENYAKGINDEKLLKAALFSKHLGTDVVLTPGKPIKNSKKENMASMAQISTLLGSNSDVLQYRLKLDEKQSGFYSTLTASNVIGNCPDKFELFTCKVEKWQQQEGKKQEAGFVDKMLGKSVKSGGSAEFVEVKAKDFVDLKGSETGLHGNAANVNLLFKFNPAGIRKAEGKYRVSFTLLPEKDDYIDSNDIFDDWNFGDDVVGDDLQSVGSKTLNVSSFVKMVSALNYEMNKPGFYDIYVYLEAIK